MILLCVQLLDGGGRRGGGIEVFMCMLCVVQGYVYVQVFLSELYARARVCV